MSARSTRLPRVSRVLITVVSVLSIVELAGFGGTYALYSRHYISTDNAQIDGDRLAIRAPISGEVTDWTAEDGAVVTRNQLVGRIRPVGAGPRTKHPVRSPGGGTVAINDVREGTYVAAGTMLAVAYDPASAYVTARVPDSAVGAVRPGQRVDISVDAYPDVPVTGVVLFVQSATSGSFTYLPPPGISDPSNPQRVDQYVPVRIALTATGGIPLTPGLNVTVHIHRN